MNCTACPRVRGTQTRGRRSAELNQPSAAGPPARLPQRKPTCCSWMNSVPKRNFPTFEGVRHPGGPAAKVRVGSNLLKCTYGRWAPVSQSVITTLLPTEHTWSLHTLIFCTGVRWILCTLWFLLAGLALQVDSPSSGSDVLLRWGRAVTSAGAIWPITGGAFSSTSALTEDR